MEKETFPVDIDSLIDAIASAEIQRASNGKYALSIKLDGEIGIDEYRTLVLVDREVKTRGVLKGRKPNPQWGRMRKARE